MNSSTYDKAIERLDAYCCSSSSAVTEEEKEAVIEKVKQTIATAERDCSTIQELSSHVKNVLNGCTHKRKALEALSILEQHAALIADDIRQLQDLMQEAAAAPPPAKKQKTTDE